MVACTDLTFVCVGTAIRPDGSQDAGAVEDAVRGIGRAIARTRRYHSVVVRSTLLPGTMRGTILPLLTGISQGILGERFGLAFNPEFLREGSAVADFRNPPRIVIGEFDSRTAEALIAVHPAAPVMRTSVEIAETVKYADNSWHALKVAFANEIDSICRACGVDSQAVMEIFCADRVLNISRAYLRPGFAFGGPCLPADVAALVHHGASKGLDLPVLSSIIASNDGVVARGCEQILRNPHKRIGLLGLSFKPGVGDLRGSPYVDLVGRLAAAGRSVRAFDPLVSQARAVDSLRSYSDKVMASLDQVLVDELSALLRWAEVVVFTSNAPEYAVALQRLRPEQVMIDISGTVTPRAASTDDVRAIPAFAQRGS
jgi:GDP-mannose 6-dehydrogenase